MHTFFLICLLLLATCFGQLCAHHQEKIPDSHSYRVTTTRYRIGTVFSPDDGHMVARNMSKKAISLLRKKCAPVQTGPGAHPTFCTMGTGSFPRVKSGHGVTLTHHPLLLPWSRKGRTIPLLPLWAVRPVQSLSACTRVHFTFTFI